ncbi:hypothetical protein DFH27DRAFT_332389 [Peziza echinospora]|nr:hypothetical protein DFH27DRAFT_332389 [Peziza echinospora]
MGWPMDIGRGLEKYWSTSIWRIKNLNASLYTIHTYTSLLLHGARRFTFFNLYISLFYTYTHTTGFAIGPHFTYHYYTSNSPAITHHQYYIDIIHISPTDQHTKGTISRAFNIFIISSSWLLLVRTLQKRGNRGGCGGVVEVGHCCCVAIVFFSLISFLLVSFSLLLFFFASCFLCSGFRVLFFSLCFFVLRASERKRCVAFLVLFWSFSFFAFPVFFFE